MTHKEEMGHVYRRLAAIEKHLPLLTDAPGKDNTETVCPHCTPEQNRPATLGKPLLTDSGTNNSTDSTKGRRDNSLPWWAWKTWKRVLTVFVGLAAIGYAVVTYWLWYDANSNFKIEQRPWIKIKHQIVSPLTFNVGGLDGKASITLSESIENVGQSVAVDVFWRSKIIIVSEPEAPNVLDLALKWQHETCEGDRRRASSGFAMFPHDPFPAMASLAMSMKSVIEAAKRSRGPLENKVSFLIAGCVSYASPLDPRTAPTHQTRFTYMLTDTIDESMYPWVYPTGVAARLRLQALPYGLIVD
jgi:hypothetical protein